MSRIVELSIADEPSRWRAAGFAVGDDGCCPLGTVSLVIRPGVGRGAGPGADAGTEQAGLVAWVLTGTPVDDLAAVDGLATSVVDDPVPPGPRTHPNGALGIDHLVVTTPDVDRTVDALQRTVGVPLRRTREGEAYGRPVRQAFFRLGEVVLEVVGPPESHGLNGPAKFFGLAVTVASLDEAVALLGPELVSRPKEAVQPGRWITTIGSAAGLRVPVALMSP